MSAGTVSACLWADVAGHLGRLLVSHCVATCRDCAWRTSRAPLTEADEKVAQQMNIYWANFVKTGNRNGAGRPDWPAYHSATDMLIDFTDSGPVAKTEPWKKRLDLTEELASKQANK